MNSEGDAGRTVGVRVELARAWMAARHLAALEVGRTVEMSRPVGRGVEVRSGGRTVGRGELVVLAGSASANLGVRLREIVAG